MDSCPPATCDDNDGPGPEAGAESRSTASGCVGTDAVLGAAPGPAAASPSAIDLLLESMGDGVFEWDLVHDTIWFSPRWKMLFGYEGDELPDRPDLWRLLTHPDDLAEVDALLRSHLEEVWPFSHSWRMRHHNGEWRWVLCRATSTRDANGVATLLLAVFTDITDQVRAEERQRALATAIPDLLLRLRADGMVLDEKRSAEGADLASAAAIVVDEPLVTGDGAGWTAVALAAGREAIATGARVVREHASPSGDVFLELRAVKSGQDEAVCIVRDITARKIVERRERELQAQVNALLVAEKERLADELTIAAHMQTSLLPTTVHMETLDICSQMWPASEVGGDYFDVMPCHDGGWFAIGDVSGHGLNAGIIMLMVQSGIATMIARDPDATPSAVLRAVNRMLHQNIRHRLKSNDFVTLNLVRYWNDGRIVFAGAHEDMLILRAADQRLESFAPIGLWLGLTEDLGAYVSDTAGRLDPGDLLVLYTDGVTEAQNDRAEQFGPARLAACVREVGDRPLDEIRDHVLRTVSAWTSERRDDMSLVIARHRRPP